MRDREPLDFALINDLGLDHLPSVLGRLLPGGRVDGHEYTVKNPTRVDNRPGSFRVNMVTGRWSDFATGDKGGDPISLVAYIEGLAQGEAARLLARLLGLDIEGGRRFG